MSKRNFFYDMEDSDLESLYSYVMSLLLGIFAIINILD